MTDPNHTKLTAGMELWWVPSSQYGAKVTVTVEKVGRKWAALSNRYRVDVETLHGDGGAYSSPGRAWLSQAAYEAHMDIVVAWADLRNDLQKTWRPPAGIDVSAINAARRALGLEVHEAALSNRGEHHD